MSDNPLAHARNLILQNISLEDRRLLVPHLQLVHLNRSDYLARNGERIEHVYFMENGVASMTSLSADGERTEIGVLGYEGIAGASVVLGSERAAHEMFIQIGDASAWRMEASRFVTAVESSATLARIVLRLIHTTLVQTGQSAVAYARYHIEGRLARWLLLCRDRTATDDLKLTHEYMAAMIGARRSGVTLALHVLEGAGMIRSARGVVTIVNRDKLLSLAGDSYGLAEAEYRRLIAPFGLSPIIQD